MARYRELALLRRAGIVTDFERQVAYELAGVPPVVYRADFVVSWASGETTVEDVKGHLTEGYRIKKRLMRAKGIEITEIRRWAKSKNGKARRRRR